MLSLDAASLMQSCMITTLNEMPTILVEVKYGRDTDPAQQRERASQQHQVLRETIQKYAPQATVDQVTLTLGVSGVIYNSVIKALKDKLGVTQESLSTLINKLHHMAVASLNRIWDQRWAIHDQPTSPGRVNSSPPAYCQSSPKHLKTYHPEPF